MKELKFNESSPFYEKNKISLPLLIKYFEETWMYGAFPPALWNVYNKSSHLTNNPHEGMSFCAF